MPRRSRLIDAVTHGLRALAKNPKRHVLPGPLGESTRQWVGGVVVTRLFGVHGLLVGVGLEFLTTAYRRYRETDRAERSRNE